MDLAAAYEHCESITRQRARNFYYGIRLLPRDKRAALCAVYAFARRVDDVGDGDLPPGSKLDELKQARETIAGLDSSPDPVALALDDVARRFTLPLAAFSELIDGVEMDVCGATYPTFDDLRRYCRCVAGSIGRLSVSIFGSNDPRAEGLADTLGIAMQLTNILRDVLEDADCGRVYLPKEDLTRFGCDGGLRQAGDHIDNFTELVAFETERARQYFDEGLRLLPLLDRRSTACVATMAGIYRRLLTRIERNPSAVLHGRISLPAREKASVALLAVTQPSRTRRG